MHSISTLWPGHASPKQVLYLTCQHGGRHAEGWTGGQPGWASWLGHVLLPAKLRWCSCSAGHGMACLRHASGSATCVAGSTLTPGACWCACWCTSVCCAASGGSSSHTSWWVFQRSSATLAQWSSSTHRVRRLPGWWIRLTGRRVCVCAGSAHHCVAAAHAQCSHGRMAIQRQCCTILLSAHSLLWMQ